MRTGIYFIFIFLMSAVSFAQKTVCTITLNSDDEKKLFQAKYKKEAGIRFVELTDFKKGLKNENDWFTKACASGVQCDSLIISGHFGGTFFGENTSLTLPLSTLDKKSCERSCQGILNRPSEVYLFGCNTLADKTKDHRTPAEYRRVLIEDGISDDYVERIVAARYSPIGESFKTSMQKIFAGVPQIYGFDSVGPSGKNVAPKLSAMLNKIPSYSKRLEELQTVKVMAAVDNINKVASRFGSPWNDSMQGTAFTSCSGNADSRRKECGLFDVRKSTHEKLLLAESLMNGKERKNYFLGLEEFFKDKNTKDFSFDEMEVLKRINSQREAAQELKNALPKMNATLDLKFKMLNLASKLGWIDEDGLQKEYESHLKTAAKVGFRGQAVSSLCGGDNPPKLSPSLVSKDWFRQPGFLTLLSCWQTASSGGMSEFVMQGVTKQLSHPDSEMVVTAMRLLENANAWDQESQIKVAELLYHPETGVASAAMTTLATFKNPSGQILEILRRGLSSANDSERRRSAYTVRNMKIQDPDLKRKALQIDPDMQPW